MSVTREEQETTVNYLPKEDTMIYSANPSHIRKLKAKVAEGKATLIRETEDDITVSVPAGKYDPIRGFKTARTLTDEQREEMAERFRKVREQNVEN